MRKPHGRVHMTLACSSYSTTGTITWCGRRVDLMLLYGALSMVSTSGLLLWRYWHSRSVTHSVTHSLARSFTRSLNHSLTHTLTHSFTRSLISHVCLILNQFVELFVIYRKNNDVQKQSRFISISALYFPVKRAANFRR